MKQNFKNLIKRYAADKGALVPLLQAIQRNVGYISEEAVASIALAMGISESVVFGVASFYAQFRFTEPGRHKVKVCLGTACHVRGGENILSTLERELAIRVGKVTADKKFELERVACVGCCALAPVVVVDNDVHGKLMTAKVRDILKCYE